MADIPELLEMRFKRYLHYGSEQPIYRPGCRFHHKSYCTDSIPSLIKISEGEEPEKIIDIIKKVKSEETSPWPDTLVFALAYCTCANNPDLQSAAYKTLRVVCRTSRDILLFMRFYRELKNAIGKKGGGRGFKKAIADWYLIWMPFDLADILLHQKGYFGYRHRDVLRLAHVKPVTIEQNVLFSYTKMGLGHIEKQFGDSNNEQVKELIDYIRKVENIHKLNDPIEAEKRLGDEVHNIERIPPCLLKHQEVWNKLIPNMDVKTVLENLQRISIYGFLKSNNVTVNGVMDVLNNLKKAEQFKSHPIRVYIELQTYEKAAKYCLDMAIKLGHPTKNKDAPAKKPPKLNLMIKNSLMTFYLSLHKFQKPTNLRYFIAVDLRAKMSTDRCHGCMYLTPLEAANALCLSLLRVEPENNVTVGTFKDPKGEVEEIKFSKNCEISKLDSTFNEKVPTAGPAAVAAAIHWATVNKKPIDVFIILSNFTLLTKGTRLAIQNYRAELSLPNAKVVTCSLSGIIRAHKDVEGQNMMCIMGFDEHVPRIIEAFAKGSF